MKKEAACILIENQSGRFLAVARRGTTNQFGLPGGKLDPNEDAITCAIRELKEETSLVINPSKDNLIGIFKREDTGFVTTTFIFKYGAIENPRTKLKGDAGPAAWITEEELISGPFGEYNKNLLVRYRSLKE